MENQFEKEAYIFTEAIKKLASSPVHLDNLQSYLSTHFDAWLEKYASTPADIAVELNEFANM